MILIVPLVAQALVRVATRGAKPGAPGLTPAGGGFCVAAATLQPADLIVTTTASWEAGVIRAATMSPVSHAMLYLGDDTILDATIHGVKTRRLAQALLPATLAVAFRMQRLDPATAAKVLAAAQSHQGAGYDFQGAMVSGFAGQFLPEFAAALAQTPDRFYCSELISSAFEAAGVPLAKVKGSASNPRMVVQSPDLRYFGHLKVGDPVPGHRPGA